MSLLNSLIPSFNRSLTQRADSGVRSPSVKPTYDVKETAEAFGVTVQLPGVAKDGLEITAAENQLRIVGQRTWKRPETWTALYRETSDLPFELVLTHDNTVDVEKIHAELNEGVLRVSLPKTEAIKPRKIAVA